LQIGYRYSAQVQHYNHTPASDLKPRLAQTRTELPTLHIAEQRRPSCCLGLAMDPNPNPSYSLPHERLAALALRRDLPPDFAGAEIDNDAEAKADDDDDEEDEGYLTAVSRGGSSTCAAAAWREAAEGLEEDKDGEDISPPSPSSSGYAGERGSSLASSAGIEEPDPEPDGVGVQDWARDKKHLDEVQIRGQVAMLAASLVHTTDQRVW
jgi:hypothetical protein